MPEAAHPRGAVQVRAESQRGGAHRQRAGTAVGAAWRRVGFGVGPRPAGGGAQAAAPAEGLGEGCQAPPPAQRPAARPGPCSAASRPQRFCESDNKTRAGDRPLPAGRQACSPPRPAPHPRWPRERGPQAGPPARRPVPGNWGAGGPTPQWKRPWWGREPRPRELHPQIYSRGVSGVEAKVLPVWRQGHTLRREPEPGVPAGPAPAASPAVAPRCHRPPLRAPRPPWGEQQAPGGGGTCSALGSPRPRH